MTPEDLNEAVDAVVAAVASEPVLVVLEGREHTLDRVEARTDGRLVLHAIAPRGDTVRVTRELLAQLARGDWNARRAAERMTGGGRPR